MTTTRPTMRECSAPQYCELKLCHEPVLSAWNQRVEYRPGTTSVLTRNAGRKNEWITSSEVMVILIGVPTGTWSSLISRRPSGCWIFHIHCLPTTVYSTALAGGRAIVKYSFAPQ